jgi:hypothetical protein
MYAQRSLQIHHIEFETALNDMIVLVPFVTKAMPGILGHAVQREHFHTRYVLGTPTKNHPTFARNDVLGDIEAEAAEIPERADPPSLILTFYRMSTIFDHEKIVLVRDLHDPPHVTRPTSEMDRQNSARPRSYCRFDRLRRYAHSFWINIREDWLEPGMDNRIDGGAEGQWSRYDLRSLLDISRDHTDL